MRLCGCPTELFLSLALALSRRRPDHLGVPARALQRDGETLGPFEQRYPHRDGGADSTRAEGQSSPTPALTESAADDIERKGNN
jgi:hypothetical protein